MGTFSRMRGTWLGLVGVVVGFLAAFIFSCVGDAPTSAVDGGLDAPADNAVPDSGVDVATIDAAPDAPPCDLTKPFGTPQLISGINTAAIDEGAHLSPDELVMVFDSDRDGGVGRSDLYYSTRKGIDKAFDPPTILNAVNSTSGEYWPTLSADKLTLLFSSERPGNNGALVQLFIATRQIPSADFGAPTKISALNAGGWDNPDWLRPDGQVLYFTTSRDGPYHIYQSTVVSGVFQAPTSVVSVNDDQALLAVLSPDELTIYWSSGRTAPKNVGLRDVFTAHRPNANSAFSAAVNVAEVNSTGTDSPSWLSPDGCRLYLTSDRANGVGAADIYVAERPK